MRKCAGNTALHCDGDRTPGIWLRVLSKVGHLRRRPKIGHVANELSDSAVQLAHNFEKEFRKVFIIYIELIK